MKRLLITLAVFAATVYCDIEDKTNHADNWPCTDCRIVKETPGYTIFRIITRPGKTLLDNMTCTDSKIVVEEAPEVTYFRIIADSGETLLDINSNNTKLTPIDLLISSEVMHPDFGFRAFANNTRYYLTKNQTTGGDIIRLAAKIGFDIFKENAPEETFYNATLIKSDFRCVRIHGFSLVIDPAFDIKKYDGYNMTALLWSTVFGLSDVARDLVERGADVNQRVDEYGTPVMAAILRDEHELLEFMIQRGADIVHHGKGRFSTLHFAAFAGRPRIARILIDHGVDVNEDKNLGGQTPLRVAALYGQCDTIESLIIKGANVSSATSGNATAFKVAIAAGNMECGRAMLAVGVGINEKDDDGNTALIYSLLHNNDETELMDTVDRFVRHFNPDLNIRNNKGETALSIATKKNFTKIVELLKLNGAV